MACENGEGWSATPWWAAPAPGLPWRRSPCSKDTVPGALADPLGFFSIDMGSFPPQLHPSCSAFQRTSISRKSKTVRGTNPDFEGRATKGSTVDGSATFVPGVPRAGEISSLALVAWLGPAGSWTAGVTVATVVSLAPSPAPSPSCSLPSSPTARSTGRHSVGSTDVVIFVAQGMNIFFVFLSLPQPRGDHEAIQCPPNRDDLEAIPPVPFRYMPSPSAWRIPYVPYTIHHVIRAPGGRCGQDGGKRPLPASRGFRPSLPARGSGHRDVPAVHRAVQLALICVSGVRMPDLCTGRCRMAPGHLTTANKQLCSCLIFRLVGDAHL